MTTPEKIHVLAYDLERTGSTANSRVIAIGSSVVNQAFEEVDSLLAPCFKPNEALFEFNCVEEFWLGSELKELAAWRERGIPQNQKLFTPRHVLKKLEEGTPATIRTQDEAEKLAIDKFVDFVVKHETLAATLNAKFLVCSDCTESDTHWINKLLEKYRPDLHPFPFSFRTQQWSKHYDVGQIQRGFLTRLNPHWITQGKNATKTIEENWKIPPKTKEHNHMPDSDAYTIAFDMQALLMASSGQL